MFLIVDGYNIIGAWPEFRGNLDLAQSRDRLVSLLADYAGFTGHRVTCVFDGYRSGKRSLTVEEVAGITVVFTRQHETADHYIERTVDQILSGLPHGARTEVRVATSDALEQSVILARGAIRVPALELRRDLLSVKRAQTPKAAAHGGKQVTFYDHLSEQQRQALEKLRRGGSGN